MLEVRRDTSAQFASQYPRRRPPQCRDFQDVADRCVGRLIEFKVTKKLKGWKVVVVAVVTMNMCSILSEITQLTR